MHAQIQPVPYSYIDAGFAARLAPITTVGEDLGALFFSIICDVPAAFRAGFDIPDDHDPVGAAAWAIRPWRRSAGSAWRGVG